MGIPAQAGTEGTWTFASFWIPAFAGMTLDGDGKQKIVATLFG